MNCRVPKTFDVRFYFWISSKPWINPSIQYLHFDFFWYVTHCRYFLEDCININRVSSCVSGELLLTWHLGTSHTLFPLCGGAVFGFGSPLESLALTRGGRESSVLMWHIHHYSHHRNPLEIKNLVTRIFVNSPIQHPNTHLTRKWTNRRAWRTDQEQTLKFRSAFCSEAGETL